MGKTPKVKKREVSLHSRAARRGASPPSKEFAVKAPVDETDYKPWLHNAQNAGISKKKKTKALTRQQKVRQQKGLEHAERNTDRMQKKVADSKIRGKKVDARRADWVDLNEELGGKVSADEVKAVKEGDSTAMQGAKLPNLEQPVPIRVADTPMESVQTAETNGEVKGSVLPTDQVT